MEHEKAIRLHQGGMRVYLRVSTDEQAAEGYSLAAQERACTLYCQSLGMPVLGVYRDDGYTGTNNHRPGLRALLGDVQPQETVLVHKLDRLSRNVRLLLETLEMLKQGEVSVVSVSEQIDFSSPIGRVILTILAAFGQYYVDNLRDETRKGLREKAQGGLWVGPVPLGYRRDETRKGVILPSPDAPLVQEVYRLYIEGLTYEQVAATLNSDWPAPTDGRIWGRENVRVILRNRAYLGYVSSGGVEYQGSHEPLISAAQWDQVAQRRAAATRPRATTPRPAPGPLHGLLYCAGCGRRLWFKYADQSRSFYCRGQGKRDCAAHQMSAEQIERHADALVALVAATAIRDVADRLYVADGEIVRILPTPRYRKLLEALGYAVANPANSDGGM